MTVSRVEPRIVMATGIGGQGIQLVSQVLAHAAMAEGLEVMLFGSYGGMMRGGNTDTTIVLGDTVPDVPPVAPRAWAGLVMHHDYLEPLAERVTPETVLYVNSSVVPPEVFVDHPRALRLPVLDEAQELGATMAASMVLLGALCRGTGLVGLPALAEAVAEVIPPYRRQHVELNCRAIEVGFGLSPVVASAWPTQGAT